MNAYLGGLIWENNHFDLKGFTFGSLFSTGISTTTVSTGYVDGFYMVNGYGSDLLYRPFCWIVMDINDMHLSCSLHIQQGGAKDFKISNSSFKGFVHLTLSNFPTLHTGDYKTVTLENVDITVTDAREVAGTSFMLYTEAKDFNLAIKNVVFDSTILGNNTAGDRFFNFYHYGTTLFENCKFKTEFATPAIDLSVYADHGAVTFIDCDFGGTVISPRVGDIICFTKPMPEMATYATYADDAAATTAGYPTGYVYMTSAGELKIKL
jgi:hypothetical protein